MRTSRAWSWSWKWKQKVSKRILSFTHFIYLSNEWKDARARLPRGERHSIWVESCEIAQFYHRRRRLLRKKCCRLMCFFSVTGIFVEFMLTLRREANLNHRLLLPNVYWINSDDSLERRSSMEEHIASVQTRTVRKCQTSFSLANGRHAWSCLIPDGTTSQRDCGC